MQFKMFYRPTRSIADLLQIFVKMGTNRKTRPALTFQECEKHKFPFNRNF